MAFPTAHDPADRAVGPLSPLPCQAWHGYGVSIAHHGEVRGCRRACERTPLRGRRRAPMLVLTLPTTWATQVYYVDDTDRVRFQPRNLHNPPKTYLIHSTTLVTDGRRVLMTKEDTSMVWFLGGKHEIEGATPERTTTRTLTETTRFKVSETNLRHLGSESSGHNKRDVFIARVRKTEHYVNSSSHMGYMEGINFGAAYGLLDWWRSAFSPALRDFWKTDRR
jgi:hypothetical protein